MKEEKLKLHYGKVLKLTNVVGINLADDLSEYNKKVSNLNAYIRTKGAEPIGPLIQYMKTYMDENGELKNDISLYIQANQIIEGCKEPYNFSKEIRKVNCMYVRYIGEQSKIKYAYDKLYLTAFENDILLSNNSYTIFVNQMEVDKVVVDIFAERIEN